MPAILWQSPFVSFKNGKRFVGNPDPDNARTVIDHKTLPHQDYPQQGTNMELVPVMLLPGRYNDAGGLRKNSRFIRLPGSAYTAGRCSVIKSGFFLIL
jgi:hypothetical protein